MQTNPPIEISCSLLANERRRSVLQVLADASETMTRTELARTIALDGRPTGSVERTDAVLYHVHLPKLADENAIRYDTDAETVTITEYGRRLLQSCYGIEWKLAE